MPFDRRGQAKERFFAAGRLVAMSAASVFFSAQRGFDHFFPGPNKTTSGSMRGGEGRAAVAASQPAASRQ